MKSLLLLVSVLFGCVPTTRATADRLLPSSGLIEDPLLQQQMYSTALSHALPTPWRPEWPTALDAQAWTLCFDQRCRDSLRTAPVRYVSVPVLRYLQEHRIVDRVCDGREHAQRMRGTHGRT